MDTATLCPVCLQEDAISDGYCRFCKKRITVNYPAGVLPPGVVLHGRYITGIHLGQGGFGTIYKALDLVSRQVVAIKEYFPAMWCSRPRGQTRLTVTSPEEYSYGLKHFWGEAQIIRSLRNVPEVVRLYDSFDENNTGYYVMEYLDGETVQSYLRGHGEKLSFSDTVKLLMPAIVGLCKIHQTGTTHRDISPDNLFLCRDGTVRILDFGAAASKSSDLSRSFIPVEKEGYSPPEQHTISNSGDRQGNWSDIYAMAGTVYRCTVGRRPPNASARQAGDELEFGRSGLTQQQIRTLEKNLSLKPEERCQSMLAFGKELTECLSRSEANALYARYPALIGPVPPPPPPPPPEPPPLPVRSSDKLWGRRLAALLIDMLFFQLVPFAFSQLLGGPVLAWLFLGFVLGVLVTGLMTASNVRGGPGEVLCGLEVSHSQRKLETRDALLYAMIRFLWPAECIYYLLTKQSLNRKLSGCYSHKKGEMMAGQRPTLKITAGFFEGSSIPLAPGSYVFGRNPERCNFVFPMVYNVVSRIHLELAVDAALNITAINRSSQGTWVNNRLLNKDEAVKLPLHSTIVFGNEKMIITTV